MSTKKYHLTAEQLVCLRNNLIISEALDEESATPADSPISDNAEDYVDTALPNVNRKPADPKPTNQEKSESEIYGDIAKGLYNYMKTYNLSSKIADELEQANQNLSVPMTKQFIEKLLYGVYQMAKDPAQQVAFSRFLQSIGALVDANLITKDNTLRLK